MRKVLRFCRVANFVTVPTLILTFGAILPGDLNGFYAVMAMVVYTLAVFLASRSFWAGVRDSYLKTTGYKLRDANMTKRTNLILFIIVIVTLVFSRIFLRGTVVDFVAYSISVLVNLVSLLVLVWFVVTVRLGHKIGKILYVEPHEWCTPTTVYRDGKTFTVLSDWRIPEE